MMELLTKILVQQWNYKALAPLDFVGKPNREIDLAVFYWSLG